MYERFVQQESGNYSVEHGSDSAVWVKIHGASPDSDSYIEVG